MKKYLSVFLAGLALVMLFAACDPIEGAIEEVREKAGGGTAKSYIVTFDVNDGETTFTAIVDAGKTVERPSNLIWPGHGFVDWFEDNGTFLLKYTFDKPVTKNITLYAKWDLNYYTITFELSGGDSVQPVDQDLGYGAMVDKPVDPVRSYIPLTGLYAGTTVPDSYIFDGWFDEGKKWEFDIDTVYDDMTLTAQWTDPMIDTSEQLGANTVVKAIAYANKIPDTYLLLVCEDVVIEPQTLSVSDLKLTLIGLGGERKIKLQSSGSLFTLGGTNRTGIELCLGNNITLEGLSSNTNSLIYVNSGAALIMNTGSLITGNEGGYYSGGVYVGGNFTMNGGTIFGTTSSGYASGGGVYVALNGTFTIYNGTISACNPSQYGGGVSVNGTFYMHGGTISDHTGPGWGVLVHDDYDRNPTFTMYGGTISDNFPLDGNLTRNCGGVRVRRGTFTMQGGTISNNAGPFGGGVYVDDGGTFNMSGGIISGNTSGFGGGGVYMVNGGSFTKKNGGTIYGYTPGDINSNIVKYNNIISTTEGSAVLSYPNNLRESTAGPLVNLDSAKDGSEGGWVTDVPGANLTEKFEWLKTNASSNAEYFVEADANEILSHQNLSGPSNITVKLIGRSSTRTITNEAGSPLFTVGSGVTLILDNYITLQGQGLSIFNYSPLLRITGGELIMNPGSLITGNAVNAQGGGINMTGGTLHLNGGAISGNKSYSDGGGIYISGGTFTMSDGSISGNATSGYGGGVYIAGATFTMSGGTISGNSTTSFGGGVHVHTGTFTKNGGEIYGYTGGDSNSNVVKDNSDVVQNERGHAVYINSSPPKRRETYAGTGVDLNSNTPGSGGGWEN